MELGSFINFSLVLLTAKFIDLQHCMYLAFISMTNLLSMHLNIWMCDG